MPEACVLEVSELSIYPIKSCGPITLATASLVSGGLQGDRRYMLLDEKGTFLSGRTEPRLLSVRLRLLNTDDLTEGFIVSASGQPDLYLPAEPPGEASELVVARVWRDELHVSPWESGSLWFEHYLKRKVRLVYQPEDALRQVNPKRSRPGDLVSCADAYPLLLCSEESLAHLNARLPGPIPMVRFRPNVVVRGASAFAEDRWARLALGPIEADVPKLCDRCVITTIDPFAGHSAKEPLKTLARYRRWDRAVWFGANLIPRNQGTMRRGDLVRVLRTRPHPHYGGDAADWDR